MWELKIIKNKPPVNDINLLNYSRKFCSQSSSGGTLLHSADHLSYKPRKNISIYKSCEFELTLIEISKLETINIIIGCSCKHPGLNLNYFNNFCLNDPLDKLFIYNNAVFLLVGSYINLLSLDQDTSANEFLDFLLFHFFLSHKFPPTRAIWNSKILTNSQSFIRHM